MMLNANCKTQYELGKERNDYCAIKIIMIQKRELIKYKSLLLFSTLCKCCAYFQRSFTVFPVKTGATPTTQTQSGLLPRLWNVEAKFLVQCAAQRCTDANKIKGTIHLSRCERKNTSHNSETANDINTNARRLQEE